MIEERAMRRFRWWLAEKLDGGAEWLERLADLISPSFDEDLD